MSDTPPPLSGRLASIKPWHYMAIAGSLVAGLLLLPWLKTYHPKIVTKDAEKVAALDTSAGTSWSPPEFPVITPRAVYNPPPIAKQAPEPAATPPIAQGAPVVHRPEIPDFRMFGHDTEPPPPPVQAGRPGSLEAGAAPAATEPSGSIGALLNASTSPGYYATRVDDDWAIIPEGTILACNSVTPMTSELPGYVKAKLTYDVYGHDGTTRLLDRNSDIVGEIGHGLSAGQERLFVLWRNIRTPPPNSIKITLNSPAADEVGEAGLPGDINHHIWPRIGGALLLSGVNALLEGVGNGIGSSISQNRSNGGLNLNLNEFQSQGSSLSSALLQNTIQIPDTLHRDQGLPCSIFVSGDLNFSKVYALRLRRVR